MAGACLATLVASTAAGAFTGTPGGKQAGAGIAAALAELQAANDAWKANDGEYRRQRDEESLGGTDASDFAEFVAKLRRQVLIECERYRNAGGDPVAAGIDCGRLEEGRSGVPPVADVPVLTPASTEAEKDAALDAELRAIEESLDTMLDSSQPVFADIRGTQQAATRGGAAGTGAREGTGGNGADAGTGEYREAGAGSGDGSTTTTARGEGSGTGAGAETGEGGSEQTGTRTADGLPGGIAEQGAYQGAGKTGAARAPPRRAGDVVGGVDDDALARQLREAAESEPDPVLKEKLWEEYRKYKGSLR